MNDPTPHQMRWALVRTGGRCHAGVEEATVLLAGRGEALDRLCAVAARVRGEGLVGARDDLALHVMARILLPGRIPNIHPLGQAGHPRHPGDVEARANDLGGTLMEETISRMAGSEHGSAKTVAELEDIGVGIGRPVHQRTTTYGRVARGSVLVQA